jgi:hypothetical protein
MIPLHNYDTLISTGKGELPMAKTEKSRLQAELSARRVSLEGDWTAAEARRILAVFERLEALSGGGGTALFNDQDTILQHSGRPGRVGRTRGGTVILDADWTDWTLAHELGHRWNNAWGRAPERDLRTRLRAGRWEWLKRPLRRFEKSLERLLKKLGIKARLDWPALWYHPGDAPPPCGADRNFNASEDLAECFASTVFPEDSKTRASKAAKKPVKPAQDWDWSRQFAGFGQTPRGQFLRQQFKENNSRQRSEPRRR